MSVRAPPQGRGPAGGGPPTPGSPSASAISCSCRCLLGLVAPAGALSEALLIASCRGAGVPCGVRLHGIIREVDQNCGNCVLWPAHRYQTPRSQMLRQIAARTETSPPASPHITRIAALVLACFAALAALPSLAGAATTPKPTAWTNDVSDAVDAYATLNGTVLAPASGTFYFEYGPTTAYGTETPAEPISSSGLTQLEAVTIPVAPGEQYHYQLV